MTSNEARAALVGKVFELTKASDTSAQYDAVEAIRKVGDEGHLIRARISVARSDALSHMAQQVVELINSHWPKE